MKLLYNEVDDRIIVNLDKTIKEDSTPGIMTFGKDNDYPQLIEKLIYGSQTAKSCAQIYSKFIAGDGFENEEIGNIVVCRDIKNKPITLDMIRRQIADSLSIFKGVYIHTNINLDYKITNTRLVPFKNCRFSKIDDLGYCSKICVNKNWSDKSIKNKKNVTFFNTFNLNKTVIDSEIVKSGGINKWNGQIYFSFIDDTYLYPLSLFDSVYLDMDSEYQIQLFRNRELRNGFADKVVFNIPMSEDEIDAKLLQGEIESFMGVDGKKSLVFQSEVDENGELISNGFKIETIKTNMNPDLFQNAEKATVNNIRKAAGGLPQVLIDYELNGLSTASGEMVIQATNYYNALTKDVRTHISEIIKEVYSNFNDERLINNTNWDIKPVSILNNEELNKE